MLVNPAIEGQLRQGQGWSYGLEAGLEKKAGKLTFTAGYTWSRAWENIRGINDNHTFPATFDRPHSLVVTFAWQMKPRWLLAANYNLSSGMRFTSPSSFYTYQGTRVPVYTSMNNDHFPAYTRFDISSSWQLNKPNARFRHSLTFAVVNLFNNKNPIFIYFNKQKAADGSFEVPTDRLNPTDITSSMRYLFGAIPSISYHFNW